MNRNQTKIAVIGCAIVSVLLIGGFMYVFTSLDNSFWITSRTIELKLHDSVKKAIVIIDKQAIHPNSMNLKMTGALNGDGVLQFGWSDSIFYRSDTLHGNFSINYKSLDWYNDTCFFKFEPLTATKGDLKIECEIFSSRK